ncbi:PLP-dependent aminotransferase family protein [Adlercreutzia agrestimuris]|uniref:aminotransferase-like domain-containing protein n=1 Tax=Adlercreutzia agrestimuris TaxID=2941324 RepID=UPI00203B3AAF|nr:PLP-dependent aminotransferase family protein [Adlercreutzia agrestimuris]
MNTMDTTLAQNFAIDDLLSDGIKSTPPSFVRAILKAASDPNVTSFAGGLPNPISFPQEKLMESMQRVVAQHGATAFQYSATAGVDELREWVANRYNQRFGTDYVTEDVLITTGSQQILDLLGKVLLDKGDGVIVEKPTYLAAIQAFALHQPVFREVELTNEGLNIAELKNALSAGAKMIYLIPNFQNPTGLTYSAEGREAVREVLADQNIVVVEDDPYGELRFEGASLPYIGGTNHPHGLIMGSFSKTVTPGMRMGYILTKDHELLRNLSIAKEAADLHTNVFSQFVILDYLKHNDLDEHLVKIRDLYRSQAQAMTDAMAEFFPAEVSFTKPEGGMFLWATLPEGISTMELFPKALERGVAFVPGDPFYAEPAVHSTMRLNFTNADEQTIRDGIKKLGEVIAEAL